MPDFPFNLPAQQKISHHVELSEYNNIPIVVIKHPIVNAAISLQGAHLLAWHPTAHEPVIWLSKKAIFKSGTAIRGGVPICWPWFSKTGTPSHGFARTMLWELVESSENPQSVNLTFQLKESPESLKLWPHNFTLLACFKLGETCEVELKALGDFETTAALHSYFHVKDINHVSIAGLGTEYTDTLNNDAIATQEGDLTFTQEVDRVYIQPEQISLIHDAILDRTIEVKHIYASDVVVWNPWAELSRNMTDMADDSYQTMVCVETARINKKLVSNDQYSEKLKVVFSVSE